MPKYQNLISNCTDDHWASDNNNISISISKLRLRDIENERNVNRLKMQRICVHQAQQQQTVHNVPERFRRRNASANLEWASFHYDPETVYGTDKLVKFEEMPVFCPYCKELKDRGESTGMYCADGKVKLQQLFISPDPSRSLISVTESDSTYFLAII